ncbi:Alpha/Beta hydrolase protein [Aspergillus granulosus]|uniref:Alpha/Beta hydrolase protein n=1 Tax=Aspergillus granulosus TaxID=176169 RepID=A0ABR4H228_9EURO
MVLLLSILRITKDALFARNLPLRIRLLMLTLQPIAFLTYTIEWLTARKFPHQAEIRIPLKRAGKGKSVRAVVYLPRASPSTTTTTTSSAAAAPEEKIPLHLNIHGGGFLGGLPEGNARFCAELAATSGAVVVSTGYRYTPVATFPDAHEDVQDVAEWLLEHAEKLWAADAGNFTASGFSVGGNLGLGVAQGLRARGKERGEEEQEVVRGFVSFEGVMDFRIPPWTKPRPQGFPEKDPLHFLQPLMDAYAGPNRPRDLANPLLHPILAPISTLPQNMYFVVGGKCILRSETEATVERLEAEARAINAANGIEQETVDKQGPDGRAVVVKSFVAEGQIHGWTEMPSFAIDVEKRTRAFGDAIRFLMGVHRAYGYVHPQA